MVLEASSQQLQPQTHRGSLNSCSGYYYLVAFLQQKKQMVLLNAGNIYKKNGKKIQRA